ncbi:hypothetical protein INT45_013298 [Circinella minor]|uniref:RING-type domain-containing protein n=1 Tax=Circinella minor TaxID=1195481 RepID=A0A8H7S4W7_9FUNG|nr:hypothetical protein INT45_013298 [Circinella minor]
MALQRFPLMTPIDGEGKIFRGFLPIHNDEYFIQVHLPENNKNTQLYGDSKLKHILENINEQQLINRLDQLDDITLFLSELQTIIEEYVSINKSSSLNNNNNKMNSSTIQRYKTIMSELKEIGFDKVVHINDTLDHIIFEISDNEIRHPLKIYISSTYPLTPLKLELDGPTLSTPLTTTITSSSTETTRTTHSNLYSAIQYYNEWIKIYRDYFICMNELDQNTRILDPDQPMGKDTFRRIALKGHCSLHLELDSIYPRNGLKAMRFYGSEKNIKSFQQLWENKSQQWDNRQSPYQNLYIIFKDQLMPKVFDNQKEDTSSDVECAICYAYKLEHIELGLLTPDIICTNDQCNRGFHPTCISEWLRSNPTTTRSFNMLFGKCPYCSEVNLL